MARDIYYREKYVETLVEGKIIHVKWKNLSKAEIIYGSCKEQIKVVQNEGCNVVIIDLSESTTTPPMECQKWFGEVMFPELMKNPDFKALINVLPASSVITKMGANHWKRTAQKSQFGFDVYETNDVNEAKKLALSL